MPVLSWLLCAERSRNRRSKSPSTQPQPSTARPRQWSASGPCTTRKPHTNQDTVPHRGHDGFQLRPARPSPQSQSFSQSYRSILPTSLTYMLLVDERLFTLETCCGYGYDSARKSHSPSDFQGPTRAHRTPQEPRCSTDAISLSPSDSIPGSLRLMKKRQLFPGHVLASPSSFALPHVLGPPEDRPRQYPMPSSGILTRFPFGRCSDQMSYPKAQHRPVTTSATIHTASERLSPMP